VSSPTQSTAEDAETEANTQASQTATVRATRTVAAPVEKVWELLISPTGTQALLGAGAVLGTKGQSWHSDDGPHGVVRSYHPLEQLRVSWHADDDAPSSLVDLHLLPEADGTRLDLVHEKLPDSTQATQLQSHWDDALARLAAAASG
jgi:uncharacterized protein YndB with AHSA1/START domain